MREQVRDALTVAAEELIDRKFGYVDVSSNELRMARARNAIRRHVVRFLENVPDDLTAIEIRDILDAAISEEGE